LGEIQHYKEHAGNNKAQATLALVGACKQLAIKLAIRTTAGWQFHPNAASRRLWRDVSLFPAGTLLPVACSGSILLQPRSFATMIYVERFQELCRHAEQEIDPARIHRIREELLELLQEEELTLLLEQRRKLSSASRSGFHPDFP
jgi:hypothetical protein